MSETILTASDAAAGQQFGICVAISADGSTIVVGSPLDGDGAGKTFVYTGTDYADETILTASDGTDSDRFGSAVAVSDNGSTIAIGAPFADSAKGKTYVYDGSGWADETILDNPGGTAGDDFGAAVAISDDASTVLVGATQQGGPSYEGRAYVCHGASWGTRVTLAPSVSAVDDLFGASVALNADGTTAVVGAPTGGEDIGTVHVYDDSGWGTETILSPGDAVGTQFGWSVDISADGSAIAVTESNFGASRGRAFVYTGASWADETLLVPPDLVDGGVYGFSIAISADGSTIAVGQSAYPDGTGGGRVVTFSGAGYATILAGAGSDTVPHDDFGGGSTHAVDLSGDGSTLVVGAFARSGGDSTGAVYVDPELAVPTPPAPPSETVFIKIYDLGVTELADISAIALEKSLTRIWNGARGFTVQAPSSDPLLTATWDDGDGLPILGDGGNRKLVVWENSDPDTDDPIFHGRIFGCERDGDENSDLVTITAFDPRVELGYETDDRAGRPCRDGTATVSGDPSFLSLHFTSSVPDQDGISGPDLIQQVLRYSQGDPTTIPIQGEGPLPIDIISGDWDLEVPPALDLNPVDSLDWPVMVGDFIQQLIATDVVDFDLRPVRPGTGLNLDGDPDPYIMVEASAKSRMGTDRTGTVHFDYKTGSFNAKAAKEVTDYSTHCDHLWYMLGPRIDAGANWRGHISPHSYDFGSTLVSEYEASAALYGGPDSPPSYDSFVRVLDSVGTEASSRPLYVALYRFEIRKRLNPRKLLYITPDDGFAALFQAPQDFDAGDVVQIKTGPAFGKELDEAQRVYGYTKMWTRENVASIGQLLTSADVAA